jgi:response regulator RpfG family c-di-GMP phosphodiesterase
MPIPEERVQVAIILYIDTDQLYMSTMKLLLEGHGFKVLLARTRDHMRQVLLANVVDLALVDHDFAREYPPLLREVRTVSPLTRTVLLGMRDAEVPADIADAYFARLEGPEKLLTLLDATIARRAQQTAQRA